jgi:hypothetical protein
MRQTGFDFPPNFSCDYLGEFDFPCVWLARTVVYGTKTREKELQEQEHEVNCCIAVFFDRCCERLERRSVQRMRRRRKRPIEIGDVLDVL